MPRVVLSVLVLLTLVTGPSGCSAPGPLDDPVAALREPSSGPRTQLQAMEELDQASDGRAPAYVDALHRAIWLPGYTPDTRRAAFERLERLDPEGLQRTLRQQLPRMTAWQGLTLLCALIADRGWSELSPALVSSWARPTTHVPSDEDRPEYAAMVRLFGADHVQDEVFRVFVESSRPAQQGLRTRAWELLERLGARDRLLTLLATVPVDETDDLFLADLARGARELGIVPWNREEILWLRKLCSPEHADFWIVARAAIDHLPAARRLELELRDVPVVVACARHRPELLDRSVPELRAMLRDDLSGVARHSHGSNFDGFATGMTGAFGDVDDALTWGDLAALRLALDALARPEIRAHLFDLADRDRADGTTEYGGILQLDDAGRFEIREFVPRVREHDRKFLASQAMMDAGYTALFHFHLHVQRERNGEYAGPGFGDVNYAQNTRTNCLVFTSVRADVLNADFYRHDRILVDLGEVTRP